MRDTSGLMLAPAAQPPAARQTAVFDADQRAADAAVQRIIAANSGRAGTPRRGG